MRGRARSPHPLIIISVGAFTHNHEGLLQAAAVPHLGMNIKTRLLSIVLIIALCVSIIPFQASADNYKICVQSRNGTLAENGLKINFLNLMGSGSGEKYSDFEIPWQDDYSVMNMFFYNLLIQRDEGATDKEYVDEKISKVLINDTECYSDETYTINAAGVTIDVNWADTSGNTGWQIYIQGMSALTDDLTITIEFISAGSSDYNFSVESEDVNKVEASSRSIGPNEYYVSAEPKPGFAFDHWEYCTSEDGQSFSTWNTYDDLKSAKGSVSLTTNTKLKACFKDASLYLGTLEAGVMSNTDIPALLPQNNGGLFATIHGDVGRGEFSPGIPTPGEAAALRFKWYPDGIITAPSVRYYNYNDAWDDLTEDFTTVTIKLYEGKKASGLPMYYLTLPLWFDGSVYEPTATSGIGPYECVLTFLMPESGTLTLSMALNNEAPSIQTITVFDASQATYAQNLKQYYKDNYGENPEGLALPNEKYTQYADVRILLQNAYELGQSSIMAAKTDEAAYDSYTAAVTRMQQLKTLQQQIDAGNYNYYKQVPGVLKTAVYLQPGDNTVGFAYVPTLDYENAPTSITTVGGSQARAYLAVTSSLEAANPGVWILYCNGLDPSAYVVGIASSGGDGSALQNAGQGNICYTHNSGGANGLSVEPLDDRDCIRVGYAEGNSFPNLATRPDKDDLLWAVAAAQEQIPAATLEASEAYQTALSNLVGWDALGCTIDTSKAEQQAIIDDALEALKAAFPDADLERYPVSAKARAVIRLINAIGTVTRQSGDAIAAAETAYAALTDEQKAEVSNYATLTAARDAYDALMDVTAGDPEAARVGVLDYLKSNVMNPIVSSTSGEWAVLAMARGGVITNDIKNSYLTNLNTKLANPPTKYTDNERITLALSSLGIDASDYGNNHTDLTASYRYYIEPSARTGEDGENETLMADIYALIALDAKPYQNEEEMLDPRNDYINGIIRVAYSGGGWNFAEGSTSADVDTTAMAIQALAPYYSTSESVKASIDQALVWLKKQQDPFTGGFTVDDNLSTCSTAQVVTALCALDIDPNGADWTVDGMTPLSALTLWYNEAGWFGETDTTQNQIATEQAAYALVAWNRYTENTNSLYDMRDAFGTQPTDDASVKSITVCGVKATASEEDAYTYTVELPSGTELAELDKDSFEIRPAVGATNSDPVTANNGETWTFTVTAKNGTTTQEYTVTVSVASAANAGNAADVADAADAIEAMAFSPVSYENAADKSAVEDWITEQLDEVLTQYDVGVTVVVSSFKAAEAGTQENRPGVEGSFKATITVYKGVFGQDDYASETIEITDGVITPKAYISSDATVKSVTCNGTDGTVSEQTFTIVLPYDTEALPTDAAAFEIITNDEKATVGAVTTTDSGKTWSFTVTAEDGEATLDYTIEVSIAADPLSGSKQTVENAKNAIENHSFTVSSETANTKAKVAEWLQAEVDTLAAALDSKAVTNLKVTPAVDGSAETSEGSNGSFTFTVALSLAYEAGNDEGGHPYPAGTIEEVTATVTGTITAKAYTPSGEDVDIEIVSGESATPIADVTATLENGTATLHVEADKPCVVIVRLADGTLERLEAVKNGKGYDFSQDNYDANMEFIVMLKGDANADGVVDGSDIAQAKAAALNKRKLSELGAIAADIDGDNTLDVSDIAQAKAAYLGKKALTW